jgi:hypothetical protein
MDKLIQTIQEQIDLVMNSKCAKKSDKQLSQYATMDHLNKWRTSEQNKNQVKQNGLKNSKYTHEGAKQIRDRFYYQNEMMIDLAREFKISSRQMQQLLANESYKIDDWDYPDFEEQKKKNKYIKDRIDEKIQFIKDGCGLQNFLEKFQCTPTMYYTLLEKYNLQSAGRHGNKRAKILVDSE